MKKIQELTFEKACEVKGYKVEDCAITLPPMFPNRHAKAMEAVGKIFIMVDAANQIANDGKEWTADFSDGDTVKWENWYEYVEDKEGGSSGFRFGDYGRWDSGSTVGSRLCFFSREVGIALGKNKEYMKLWNEFALYR
jgi:predicted lipoprotein with Yx(FWY)xxD motif